MPLNTPLPGVTVYAPNNNATTASVSQMGTAAGGNGAVGARLPNGTVASNSNTVQSGGASDVYAPSIYNPASVTSPTKTPVAVITGLAAQNDYAKKFEAYKQMTDAVAQQKTAADRQNAIDAQTKAQSDLQASENNLKQQGIDIQKTQADAQKAEAQAKKDALSLANGQTPASSSTTDQTSTGGNTTGGTQNTPTGTTAPQNTPNSGLTTATDKYVSDQQNIQAQKDQVYQNMFSSLDSVMKGTVPLSAPQQALISSLQTQLQQNVATQNQVNQSYTGTVSEAAFRSGGEYTPLQMAGKINDSITLGVGKIQELDNAAAKTIADLENSFQKQNFDEINKGYDTMLSQLDGKSTAIKDMYEKVTSDLKDQRDQQQKVTDSVNNIALEAAKNGADAATQAKIKASGDESGAIAAAGDFLQSASGTMGEYLQYKRDTQSKGLVPKDYQTYKNDQLRTEEDIKNQSKVNADNANTSSDKTQQKLEQQYRGILSKEFSSRTGSLGIENGKVAQANHLNSLVTQYFDPKTGNYNIPTSQYAELVLGLATLVAPNGTTAAADRAELMSKTAAGDIKGAIQYITGVPQNGNTQDIVKNLIDSIDRQAETATRNREAALQNMRDQAPTDLEQSRVDKLNKSTQMVKYEGQDRVSKNNVNNYIKTNPTEAENIAKLYEVPGATDQAIEDYLRAQGKLQ